MGTHAGLPTYICRKCRNPVASGEDLLSKNFVAKSGPAYMFSHAMNVVVGPKQDRELLTGLHAVADVFCSNCGEIMGWKYVRAYDAKQRYKEGNFVLEIARILKEY